jgi:hypothetical protein
LGRYLKQYKNTLSDLHLHDPEPTSIALKTCPRCHKIAIADEELKLFAKSGYCLRCTTEIDRLINPLRQGSPDDKRTPVVSPRTGSCVLCGEQSEDRAIPLHHYKYPDNKDSIELCTKHHAIEDKRRRDQDLWIKTLYNSTIIGDDWACVSIEDRVALIKKEEDAWMRYYQDAKQHPHPPNPKTKFSNLDDVFGGL